MECVRRKIFVPNNNKPEEITLKIASPIVQIESADVRIMYNFVIKIRFC